MLIYCIHNVVNGKRYIGATTMTLERRFGFHKATALRGCSKTALGRAIVKYGVDAFAIAAVASLLPGSTVDDMFDLERAIIAQEGTKGTGNYNLTEGGEGTVGYKCTPEQIQRKLGRPCSAETRAKMSAVRKGKPLSEYHRKRIAECVNPRNTGMPSPTRGQKLNPQHCAKLAAAWTPERRAAQAIRMSERRKNGTCVPDYAARTN